MKFIIPMLAVCCFALGGCKATCCGTCGGADHGHAHGDKTCCSKDGTCCKKPAAE